jgi:hypothetical protein
MADWLIAWVWGGSQEISFLLCCQVTVTLLTDYTLRSTVLCFSGVGTTPCIPWYTNSLLCKLGHTKPRFLFSSQASSCATVPFGLQPHWHQLHVFYLEGDAHTALPKVLVLLMDDSFFLQDQFYLSENFIEP